MPPREPIDTFNELPDPGQTRTLDDLVERLRALKVWAGDPSYEVIAGRVGAAWTAAGRRLAADHLRQALALFRQLGDRNGEAWTLDSLGTLHTQHGQPSQAAEYYRQALAAVRETGDRYCEGWALNGLGEAAHTAGHPADALTHHTAAVTLTADTGDRYQQARAHTGLGHAHHTLGNPTQARHHYQQAQTLSTDLGLPQAEQIRTHLAFLNTTHSEQP